MYLLYQHIAVLLTKRVLQHDALQIKVAYGFMVIKVFFPENEEKEEAMNDESVDLIRKLRKIQDDTF